MGTALSEQLGSFAIAASRSNLTRANRPPLGKGGNAVQLTIFAGTEMAIQIEMVVDS